MAQTQLADARHFLIAFSDVQKHNKEGDCWIVVHGKVYDVSTFEHPGGKASTLVPTSDLGAIVTSLDILTSGDSHIKIRWRRCNGCI